MNKIETPYTHPTNMLNPGPGKYNHEKKKDDIKTRLLVEETVHVPFGSSEERGCMKKTVVKQPVPGPGAYIDINNPLFSSVSKPLLKFSSDRTFAEAHGIKLGAFGTNSKRFDKGVFEGKPGPAPGQYDYVIDKTIEGEYKKVEKSKAAPINTVVPQASTAPPQSAGASERPHTQSVFFKSTTERFENVDMQNPTIRILKNKAKKVAGQGKLVGHTPSGSMMSGDSTRVGTAAENVVSYLNKGPDWTRQMRATDYEAFSGKRVGFDGTSPRFNSNNVFYGQSLKLDVPGPGMYQDPLMVTGSNGQARPQTFSQPRNRHLKYAVVFNTCEKRFKNKGQNSYIY